MKLQQGNVILTSTNDVAIGEILPHLAWRDGEKSYVKPNILT